MFTVSCLPTCFHLLLPVAAAGGPAAYGSNCAGLPVLPYQHADCPHLPVYVQASAGSATAHLRTR